MSKSWKYALSALAVAIAAIGSAFYLPHARGATSDAPAATGSPQSTAAVTFTHDVAPIFFSQCATCHRPGEVAPFSLLTYEEARKHAHEIEMVTHDRQMPPWKAKIGFGDFAGVRQLSNAQISTIAAWVKAGRPEGNPADLPPAPQFASGWTLGEPDLIVKMPQPFTLPANASRDVYRVFVIPLNLTEDKYVAAVDFRPSNPRIVHHSLFYLDTSGKARELEEQSPDKPGYARVGGPGFSPTGGLGGWAPGGRAHFLPDGVGRVVRKGSDLILHTHFHPTGKPEVEQSMVGLYFLKKPPEKVLITIPKARHRIDIPAGDANYRIDDSFVVPTNVRLSGIIPHAHLLCQEIKVTATFPDGTEHPLIWIPKWDWDWQEQYQYEHPLDIPQGTRVNLEYRYDNSTDNPKNPTTPPREVRWGEQTADEMALVFFQLEIDRGAQAAALGRGLRERLRERLSRSGAGPADATPSTRPVSP